MVTVKRIICLANSRKLSGRCVAGKELRGGRSVGWIRPVSARDHEEVSEYERQYEDGSDPRVLDIMDVPLLAARPKDYQQENWLLDHEQYWEKVDRAAWNDLQQLVDPTGPLWINGHSTTRGLNDEIPLPLAATLTSSLCLIQVRQLTLSVFSYYNKRRVQGRMRHDGMDYWLWVTDPSYEEPYKSKPDGNYRIGESFLTISLSEPFTDRNACYKLIAAIIERGGGAEA